MNGKKGLTDLEVEQEIERLKQTQAVKLAKAEQAILYRRRQYMYQLRGYEKRGLELMKEGITLDKLREMDEAFRE